MHPLPAPRRSPATPPPSPQVCEALAAGTPRPIILPLSRTSHAGEAESSEVPAADALAWTRGAALLADRLTQGEVTVPGGGSRTLRAVDTAYVFPGGCCGGGKGKPVCWELPSMHSLAASWPRQAACTGCANLPAEAWRARTHTPGPPPISLPLPRPAAAGLALGLMMSRSTRVREDMMIDAARAVARSVPESDREAGALLPPVGAVREVAGGMPAGLRGLRGAEGGLQGWLAFRASCEAAPAAGARRPQHRLLLARLPPLPAWHLQRAVLDHPARAAFPPRSARGGGGGQPCLQRGGGHGAAAPTRPAGQGVELDVQPKVQAVQMRRRRLTDRACTCTRQARVNPWNYSLPFAPFLTVDILLRFICF